MAAVRHLVGVFGPPMESAWSSLPLCKNWLDRCTSFDNMQVLLFCALGLKTPIHAPKNVFGALTPRMGSGNNGTTKTHIRVRKHVA